MKGHIAYKQSPVNENSFRTERFGNLLSDTIQGAINYDEDDGTWSGWFVNYSDANKNEFKLGFGSKAAAARWVNRILRSY